MSYVLIPGVGLVELQHTGQLVPGAVVQERAPAVGSLSASESGEDTAAVTGKVLVTGALAASEEGEDTASFTGTVEGAVTVTVRNPQGGAYSSRRLDDEIRREFKRIRKEREDEELAVMVMLLEAA